MAGGFSVTISAVDKASAKLEQINKALARINAPVERLKKNFAKFGDLSGFSKLGGALSEVARRALEAFQAIARILEPLGVLTSAATIAGMYKMVSAWGGFGAALGRAAQRTSMSADQLHALQGAARLSGASAEVLTSGMKTLGDTLTDAVGGRAPEAVVMLQTLGIEFRNADGSARKASAVLPELADRIARIKDPALQARAATALMGGAAEDLLPFLRRGSAGIQEYVQAARFYGVINDRGAGAATRLREAQTRLAMSAEGLGNTIAERLEPILSPLVRKLADWVAVNRDWIATGITDKVAEFARWIESVNWAEVGQGVKDFGAGVKDVVELLGGWKTVAEGLLIFMATRWLIGMLAPIAKVGAALVGVSTRVAAVTGAGALLGRAGMVGAAGVAAHEGLSALDPQDKIGAWVDRNVPGAAWLDDKASRIGLGRSYEQQRQVEEALTPRGIRNNNPLNLTYVPGQIGALGSDGRYGKYGSMAEGVAAAQRQLMRYQDRGLTTVSQMVSRWAPPGENNTASYIGAVAKRTGLDPNAPIDMRDPAVASKVIAAMARQETGRDIDAGSIAQGISMALGRPVAVSSAAPAAPSGQATITVRNLDPQRTAVTASSSGELFGGPPRIESGMPLSVAW